jgi:hypothetical protein
MNKRLIIHEEFSTRLNRAEIVSGFIYMANFSPG